MKRLAIFLIAIMVAVPAIAQESVYNRNDNYDANGWTMRADNDDVDTTFELMTSRDTVFTQLAAEDTIEVIGGGTDYQNVTVYGINNKGKQFKETITLNGPLAATSTTTARYITYAEVDIASDSTVTVRRQTGDTHILSIPPGSVSSQTAHWLNGEKNSYLTGWGASMGVASSSTVKATASSVLALRWYPDDADTLDAGDDFDVIDIITTNGEPNVYKQYQQPKKLKAGGWLAVYAKSYDADEKISTFIEGYDAR